MAMEMEEEQARTTFHKMAEMMWLIGNKNQEQWEDPGPEPKRVAEPPEPSSLLIPEDLEAKVDEVSWTEPEEDTEPVEPKLISSGYGGFLYIKCPVCGKVKGFCAKTRINNFRCDCGSVTRLENLVPLYMNCECGRNSRYLTNMGEPVFDIVCYDCGNPVPVEWNSKKKQYETIRG